MAFLQESIYYRVYHLSRNLECVHDVGKYMCAHKPAEWLAYPHTYVVRHETSIVPLAKLLVFQWWLTPKNRVTTRHLYVVKTFLRIQDPTIPIM